MNYFLQYSKQAKYGWFGQSGNPGLNSWMVENFSGLKVESQQQRQQHFSPKTSFRLFPISSVCYFRYATFTNISHLISWIKWKRWLLGSSHLLSLSISLSLTHTHTHTHFHTHTLTHIQNSHSHNLCRIHTLALYLVLSHTQTHTHTHTHVLLLHPTFV